MLEQHSPTRLFATLLVLIFCIEAGVMFALDYLFPKGASMWVAAVIDACLMTTATSVFVWHFFVRPLRFALIGEATRAKAVTESAADGIITIDEHGVIESFNRAAERMFARHAIDAIGKNVEILMPGRYIADHTAHLRTGKVRAAGRTREAMALRRDGSEFPIELNVAGFRLAGARHYTAIIRDITERRQAQERIQRLAHYDSLTGLPNRALFYDRLNQALNLARRERYQLALLFCDLDKFKVVNDTLGHEIGDELLTSAALRMRQLVRESDTVARIGGDEFTVILPRIASREDAATIASKIMDAVSAPFHLGNPKQEVSVSVSIGIGFHPADAQDTATLVKAADAAMYRNKQVGNSIQYC